MGLYLFLISIVLTILTVPLGILYTILKLTVKGKFKVLFRVSNGYFYKFAIAIDQMGNVAMQDLFNDIFIMKEGYKFGDEDENISSVLGKNEHLGQLTRLGKLIVAILDFIDPDHALNSIEE